MSQRWRLGVAVLAVLAAAAVVAFAARPPGVAAVLVAGGVCAWLVAGAGLGGSESRPEAEGEPSRETEASVALALLEPLGHGAALLDGELVVLAANPALGRIAGQNHAAMAGVSLIRATRDYALVEAARARAGMHHEVRLASGTIARVWTEPIALDLPGGRAARLLLVEDMTALEQARRARSDLVANLSHELRTPIAAAQALTETLAEGVEEEEEERRFLDRLVEEIERMSAMIQRMLRLAQLEAMDEPPAVEPMEVPGLLESARRRIAPLAERAGVAVEVEGDHAPPVLANADATEELLSNLLDNALRHSPEGGRIALAAGVEDAFVRFEVRDEGPGILPSERPRVFERFYTGDPARAARGGTGLGLAIARQLAEQQGGRIWVADRTPGATLCFTLPLAPADADGD